MGVRGLLVLGVGLRGCRGRRGFRRLGLVGFIGDEGVVRGMGWEVWNGG
jgi:hypothetical protein